MCASRLPGAVSFRIFILNSSNSNNSTTSKNLVDLSNIPEEYQEFTDVFSKKKANTLVLYWPYNLKINLEGGTEPFLDLIYSLSQSELQALQEFLNKHLALGFICPTYSSFSGSPIAFILKASNVPCIGLAFFHLASEKVCYLAILNFNCDIWLEKWINWGLPALLCFLWDFVSMKWLRREKIPTHQSLFETSSAAHYQTQPQ